MNIIPNVNILERELLGGGEMWFRSGMHRNFFSKKDKGSFSLLLGSLGR